MREMMFNLLSLAVFGFVLGGEQIGIFETPEDREERVAREEAEAQETEREEAEAERTRKELEARRDREARQAHETAVRQKEQKDLEKEAILEACREARKLDKPARKKRASQIKKDLIALVEKWGESERDIQWMQHVISTQIRPLRQ